MQQTPSAQPKALIIFFLTEMWERYGFYIIQSLLVLFLIQKFSLDDDTSYAILGSFTALAYITPILGGYLADTILGYRHAILAGGIMLCFGYSLMGIANTSLIMSLALGIISMGTGLLKPNVSGLLGHLYVTNDKRRDGGFTLFYVGINSGILLATCCGGYIVALAGWHSAFISAAIGLVLGTLVFYYGAIYFHIKDPITIKHNISKVSAAYAVILLTALLSAYIIQHEVFALVCFFTICLMTIWIVLHKAFQFPAYQRNRILAYFIMVIISIIFWAIYFQLFFSLNLFVLRAVNHDLLGLTVPTSVFMGIEAFGVVGFGLILGWFWTWLKHHSIDPSTAMKFAISMGFMTLGFGTLLLGLKISPADQLINSSWLILAYLIIALAELSLSPIGLSMVTQLVPQPLVGMMMGIWFVSLGIGGKLAGLFADSSAIPKSLHNIVSIDSIYDHAFSLYFWISLLTTVLVLLLVPVINKLINTPES